MEQFLLWFSMVANFITVLAGLLAFAGVVWAILGRAQLAVAPQFFQPSVAPHLTMGVSSVGSNPIRDLEVNYGLLDDNGQSSKGGDLATRITLSRGETVTVVGYEPAELSFGSDPREGEFRVEIKQGGGWYLNVQWQSALFPWRRASRTYSWPPTRRFASESPEELAGRKEIEFLKRTRNPSPASSTRSPDRKIIRSRAILATDRTFDDLVASHNGPVLVGFGPTWQGKVWEDFKRVLDVLPAKHGPRVQVLLVNTDESPGIAEKFAANEVPVVKLLLKGKVVKSSVGARAYPDLEDEFAEFLR